MGAQISTVSKQPYKTIKSKAAWDRYLRDAMKSAQPTVIFFTTTWSEPCKKAEKLLRDVADDHELKNVKFARVDMDQLLDVAKECRVEKMPTFLVLNRVSEYGVYEAKGMGGVTKGDKAIGANEENSAPTGERGECDYIKGTAVNDGERVRIIQMKRKLGSLNEAELKNKIQNFASQKVRATFAVDG